jgi:2-iminobutanoate/2-iminopropanoate deaminase
VSGAREAIVTKSAPAAIGPYSQAVRAEGFLYCSGQIGLDPASGTLVGGGIGPECHQIMRNLGAVLAAADLEWSDVVKTTIYLIDIGEFAEVNEIYARYVTPPYPARATVGVAALPKDARVEIEAIARLRK